MQRPSARQVRRILGLQAIFSLGLTAIVLPFGASVAISTLIGAAACWLANLSLVIWLFRPYRAQAVGELVARFYRAELLKIALVLALFGTAVALYDPLNIPVMLGVYVVVQVIPTLIAVQMGS